MLTVFAWNTREFSDNDSYSRETLESGSSLWKDTILKYFAEILPDDEDFTRITIGII